MSPCVHHSTRYKDQENQAVLARLLQEVKGLNPNFSTECIKGTSWQFSCKVATISQKYVTEACYRFYRTKVEEDSLKRRGALDDKNKRRRRRERLLRVKQ